MLPLRDEVSLSDWSIGPVPTSPVWKSERFERLAEAMRHSFSTDESPPGAALWNTEHGFDGSVPADVVLEAIRAAIRFAALDANDDVFDMPNAANLLATSENAALYVQPIDEQSGRVTIVRGGSLRREIVGGAQIGLAQIPLPDAVGPVARPIPLSQRLVTAAFDALVAEARDNNSRLKIVMEWHAAAMSNVRAVTMQFRLIALKTGFEALFGTSKSRDAARQLRRLFQDVAAQHVDLLPWAGLLWSPSERTDLRRSYLVKGNTRWDTRSELEDFFMTLAEARNTVIHQGVLSDTEYPPPAERPLSRYSGHLFWRGERLLREAVKASLGADVLLEGLLADWAEWQPVLDELQAAIQDGDANVASDDKGGAFNVRSARACSELLSELGGVAANEVELERAAAGTGSSLELARKAAEQTQGCWVAKAGKRQMLITSAERDALKLAGAEEPISSHFRRF